MSRETDPHALVYRAKCALHAVSQLAGEGGVQLHYVRSYDLQCLLNLVEEELSQALENMGGDPDLIETTMRSPSDTH